MVIGSSGVTVRHELVTKRAATAGNNRRYFIRRFGRRGDLTKVQENSSNLFHPDQPIGCTFGTDGPSACLKWVFARSIKVPRQRSASGSTTLKFLCM